MRLPAAGAWLLAVTALALPPWHMQQDGLTSGALLALFAADPDVASALGQALQGCWWFWPMLAALPFGLPVLSASTGRRSRGKALLLCGLLGLVALVVTRTGFPPRRALRALTVLPIITPPFVIGLGLILIFGHSGLLNQTVSAVFGIELGR